MALEKARARIHSLCGDSSGFKAYTYLRNFKNIRSVLGEADEELLTSGVDGILMDLGMSSMQVCLLTNFIAAIICQPYTHDLLKNPPPFLFPDEGEGRMELHRCVLENLHIPVLL